MDNPPGVQSEPGQSCPEGHAQEAWAARDVHIRHVTWPMFNENPKAWAETRSTLDCSTAPTSRWRNLEFLRFDYVDCHLYSFFSE